VNNPLAAAMNAVYIANCDSSLSQGARNALAIADQELQRAAHITARTLGFYREQNAPKPVELPKLIDDIVSVYANKLQERGIIVHRRYRCCACPQACFVANAGELRQVISNLLMNGMDAIRNDGILHIRLERFSSLGEGGPKIRLTIADTGGGIRTEHLRRIFEPFFTTKETVGTGLGLWISQEIVRKHGGTLRVRSQEGKGTVCCITVPAMPFDIEPTNDIAKPCETGHCAALKWADSNEKSR
jgi:signal transduction histidine kinase